MKVQVHSSSEQPLEYNQVLWWIKVDYDFFNQLKEIIYNFELVLEGKVVRRFMSHQ